MKILRHMLRHSSYQCFPCGCLFLTVIQILLLGSWRVHLLLGAWRIKSIQIH
uniref:Uncharacterized protein n=1 Tax=Rhizophora mucronata TaxID=61149 RepID=A0A2P2PVN0_RHIMU